MILFAFSLLCFASLPSLIPSISTRFDPELFKLSPPVMASPFRFHPVDQPAYHDLHRNIPSCYWNYSYYSYSTFFKRLILALSNCALATWQLPFVLLRVLRPHGLS